MTQYYGWHHCTQSHKCQKQLPYTFTVHAKLSLRLSLWWQRFCFQCKNGLCYQWEEMNTFDTVPCMAEAPVAALWALCVQTNKHMRQEKLTLPKTRIPEWCNEGTGQASESLSPGSSCFYYVVWWLYAGLLPRKTQHRLCKSRECYNCEE